MRGDSRSIVIIVAFTALSVAQCYGFCFNRAGIAYQVSPSLLEAIAMVESNMNPEALNWNRNGSKDYGLMQINSSWRDQVGEKWRYIYEPCFNVMVGAWILRQCMDRYGYSWDAVACYHAGRSPSELRGARRARAIRYVKKVQRALGSMRATNETGKFQ